MYWKDIEHMHHIVFVTQNIRWARWWTCSCLVTWFCYQLIANQVRRQPQFHDLTQFRLLIVCKTNLQILNSSWIAPIYKSMLHFFHENVTALKWGEWGLHYSLLYWLQVCPWHINVFVVYYWSSVLKLCLVEWSHDFALMVNMLICHS